MKKRWIAVAFSLMIISIVWATIASAALNAELQISGEARFQSASGINCDLEGNNHFLQCRVINSFGGRSVVEARAIPNLANVANNGNRNTHEGLFAMEDDLGTAYFFRGTHQLNNNVIFAGHQWKILRIDGNGNIRMIYNGVCPNNSCVINGNTAGDATTIGYTSFNQQFNDNAFVGFMYGIPESDTHELTHQNINSSHIKNYLTNWLNANIPEANRNRIANSPFCIDRSVNPEPDTWRPGINDTGLGFRRHITDYGSVGRLHSTPANFRPQLTCPRVQDSVSLPIGLINADEVNLAGGRHISANQDYFLRTGEWYWTMSPWAFGGIRAIMFRVGPNGNLTYHDVDAPGPVRPVISLLPHTIATGSGTATDPYIVS